MSPERTGEEVARDRSPRPEPVRLKEETLEFTFRRPRVGTRLAAVLSAALIGTVALAAVATPASATSVLAAGADSATTKSGAMVKLHVLQNDTASEGASKDALQVVSVGTPSHGTAAIYEGKYVKYTPAAGFVGTDAFTYTISDGTGTATGNVTVTVKEKADKDHAAKDKAAKEKAAKDKAAKQSSNTAKVNEACAAHDGSLVAVTSLCALHSGGQLPSWAAEQIGQLILKLVPKPDPVEAACNKSGLDETVESLCSLYEGKRLPGSIHKQIGKFILQLSGTSSSAAKLKP